MVLVQAPDRFNAVTDYTLEPCVTLVFGQSGSGKTTFAFRYLLNVRAACRFIFDWKGEAAKRLKLPLCGTPAQCEAALSSRWVCFNPLWSFQERTKEALRWFCDWTLHVAQRGPGKKVLYVDELWRFADSRSVPRELEAVVRLGRTENLELLSSTQHPRDYHADIRGEVTEWVCFNTVEPAELEAVRPYYSGVDRVAGLRPGEFIAYSRQTEAWLRGRIFSR